MTWQKAAYPLWCIVWCIVAGVGVGVVLLRQYQDNPVVIVPAAPQAPEVIIRPPPPPGVRKFTLGDMEWNRVMWQGPIVGFVQRREIGANYVEISWREPDGTSHVAVLNVLGCYLKLEPVEIAPMPEAVP